MKQMLNLNNVELYYDHVYALKGVSIELHEGETVALIGANGAGKSSILRAITGLNPIASGEIHYQGARLDGTTPADIVKQGIAMVPEGRRVFPFMSVKDNLLMQYWNDFHACVNVLNNRPARFPVASNK